MANMNEYPALTVNDLAGLLVEEVKKGNGDKKILISSDDEGNAFHGLFYGFTSKEESLKAYDDMGCYHDPVDTSKIILLG